LELIAVAHSVTFIARLLALALALFTSGANSQTRVGPLETAVKFFEANRASRCAEAFSLYTKGTQENIRAAMHREEREYDDAPLVSTPETRYCFSHMQTRRGSVRLVRQSGDEAIVVREYIIGHWSNKYIKMGPYQEGTEELRLIREDGAWRVERPPIPVGRERSPGERLVEIGRVDVSSFPHNALGQDVVEATVVSSAPRIKIESVLRDPVAWAHLFPLIQTVDVIEAAGGSQQVRLVFADWDRPVLVAVKIPGERFDKLRFDAGHNAPIMFWGWWNLSQHHSGTRVSLYLVINKAHWPGDMGERLLAPERIAQAVLGLEQAALRP
jgi:hypothetical protein